ncbi:MAG: hypothetical protein ACJ8FO_02730 [Sphingomicrobium sp.]
MSKKLRLTATAALVVLFASGTQLAVAQRSQQRGTAQKGAGVRIGPVSRPANGLVLQPIAGAIATPLTEAECKGLGGSVVDVSTDSCRTAKGCITAGKDGVMHSACITELAS